jgi:peptide/nickel transport system permease protein
VIGRLTLGGFLLGGVLAMALLANTFSPRDPLLQDLSAVGLAPGDGHPLGTDGLGRDVLARILHGARISLPVAALAALLSSAIGACVGLLAGSAGGRSDRALMRLVDMMLAVPTLALLLALAALFRSDHPAALVTLLGLTTWMPLARLVRAKAASLAQRPFFEAAVGLGASPLRCALRHVAPNVVSTVIIAATLLAGDVLLLESGLSYLGLGVAAPTPTWGDMVREGMQDLSGAWWIAAFPGLVLALGVMAFNLVGDGLRDALDPKLPPLTPMRPGVPGGPEATTS